MQILVVDDDVSILRVAERCLSKQGHQVIGINDGAEALSWIESHSVDAIVCDYELPGINGLEILVRVRDLYPSSARVLMSGALNLGNTIAAVNRGEVARVVAKPFDPTALTSAVEEALCGVQRVGEHYARSADKQRVKQAEDLESCLRNDLLSLAIQPIFDASTQACIAYEALLRSSHEVLRGPLEVLQAAERGQRLGDLSAHLCILARNWLHAFENNERLFVNLHPNELSQPDEVLNRFSVFDDVAERVVIEITERSAVSDLAAWRSSIGGLRERGFQIALDDLGAGYSSLSMLAEVRPQVVKVDMSLIRNIHMDMHRQHVVRLICQLAQTLDAKVVAEGIENEDEHRASVDCGVHLLQGYYFARPQHALWQP